MPEKTPLSPQKAPLPPVKRRVEEHQKALRRAELLVRQSLEQQESVKATLEAVQSPPTTASLSQSPSPVRGPAGSVSPPAPSYFRQVLQKLSRSRTPPPPPPPPSPERECSETPLHADPAGRTPRKAIRFASPDKLEFITPTKKARTPKKEDDPNQF